MIGGKTILKQVELGNITIEPFNVGQVGPNSYDIRLSDILYNVTNNNEDYIDTHKNGKYTICTKNKDGSYFINHGELYLGSTVEFLGSDYYVPILHGRSTAARHGLMIHFAGFCDIGWKGEITLEIVNTTAYPMKIYPVDRVGQVQFDHIDGEYHLYNSTYQGQVGPTAPKGLGDD